ncbi:hypothetical protein GY45DRAFT_1331126 [Cubamyces sp. BRFM 1775]|nr:hypothetical protein GY45DRAFT_1331126 [Cubamyces sp. BRFM 1775]
MARPATQTLTILLLSLSAISGVNASNCFIDDFGRERCDRLSTGARVGLAVAALVATFLALFLFWWARRRRQQRANMAYVGTAPPPPGPGQPGVYGVYVTPYQYSAPSPYGVQYPAPAHGGQSPYYPPNVPLYAPPPGPPPTSAQTQFAPSAATPQDQKQGYL